MSESTPKKMIVNNINIFIVQKLFIFRRKKL